jgi:hypothetical protein
VEEVEEVEQGGGAATLKEVPPQGRTLLKAKATESGTPPQGTPRHTGTVAQVSMRETVCGGTVGVAVFEIIGATQVVDVGATAAALARGLEAQTRAAEMIAT